MSAKRCAETRPALYEAVRDRLADAERRAVAAHLRACAACRAEKAALVRALSLARTGPAIPPPWLSARTAARIRGMEQEERRRISWRRLVPQLTAAGALAAAATLAVSLLRPTLAERLQATAVSGARTAADAAPAWRAAASTASAGRHALSAIGKALEATLGI